MSKMVKIVPAIALWLAVLAVVVVAEEASTLQDHASVAADGVKDKAGDVADGAKSWKDWAVGKISEQWNDDDKEESTTTTSKLGEAKDKVISMATDTQGKASEAYESAKVTVSGHAKAASEAYESAKGTVSGQAKAGYEATKETVLPEHNDEL